MQMHRAAQPTSNTTARMRPLPLALAACVALLFAPALAARQAQPTPAQGRLQVPVEYYKLPNGLKVVLSRDTTTPTVAVAVYYKIGFRNEPKDRTGFAHLFEHMMFQGSANLGKMQFIRLVESNGGLLNGSTRFDFTNYFQVIPSHVLETVLWAEADRMRGLDISPENLKNQQDVVKSEVRVNVLNQPYGGFPWIDLPMAANENWYNAHNFYGDLEHLDAATIADVEAVLQDVLRAQQCRAGRVRRLRGGAGQDVGAAVLRRGPRRRRCRRRQTCASRDRKRRSAPAASTRSPPVRRSGSRTTSRSGTHRSGMPSA